MKISMKELKKLKNFENKMREKEVTLIFNLPDIEYKNTYTLNEILTEILMQKSEFIDKKGIEPKYIRMSDPLINYLIFQNKINEMKTIYGMEILRYKWSDEE